MTRRYERPAVLASLPQRGHAVIEASAGTGKTYTIEHLILDLLLRRETTIDQILVVTFTDKATHELGARVRAKLGELVGDDWPEADPKLPADRYWLIGKAERRLLEQALLAFDTAHISTIHAFCQRVLTEHAFANHRLFEQTQVDEKAAFGEAFVECLRKELACDAALSPYLEAWLADHTVDELAQLLFDAHCARAEIRPPFDAEALATALAAIPATASSVELPGLHGSTRRALKDRLDELAGVAAAFRSQRSLPAALRQLDELKVSGKQLRYLRSKLPTNLPPELAGPFSAYGRQAVSFSSAVVQLFLPKVRAWLERNKRALGQFDFHDMLELVDRSLEGAGGPTLTRALRSRYRWALVDEFQDTDDIQWSIFRRLFFDSAGENPLVVIGDPKQAIYSFRGADVHTYLEARSAIVQGGGAVVPLTANFRSTGALIAAYNRILAGSFFSGSIRYDAPVSCGDPMRHAIARDGQPATPVVLVELPPEADLPAGFGDYCAKEIVALLAGKLRFGARGDEAPLNARDILILTRTAREGELLGERLRLAGVAHAFYKQEGLFDRDEAADVRDLLFAIDDPHDRSKRLRAWLTPFFGLRLRDLAGCRDLPGAHPLLQRLLDWQALAADKDYPRLFARILEDSGIIRRELLLHADERALTNYLHLFELLLEEQSRTRGTLRELAHALGAFISGRRSPEGSGGDMQRLESEREAVQIMTIHKAKGLEAAVVFLYSGVSRSHGSSTYHDERSRVQCIGDPGDERVEAALKREQVEEDERLLYVALTRAKARLYLPYLPPPRKVSGLYRPLNDRLLALVTAGAPRELFTQERALAAAPPPSAKSAFVGWQAPPSELSAGEAVDELAELRRHAGFVITSYSGLKRAHGGYQAPAQPEDSGESKGSLLAQGELPGGAATGIFVHALLQRMPMASFAESPPFERWRELPEVRRVLDAELRRHGVEPAQAMPAARLAYAAFTRKVPLAGQAQLAGLAQAARSAREVEFVYPIPEAAHPPLSEMGGALQIGRGFVRGFIDLLFEHQGRVYLADWKTDLLPGFGAAAMAAHVERNYRLQARLYTLALVKMLGLRSEAAYEARFGGFLFCFVRGMAREGGVRFERARFVEVERSEAAMRDRGFLGSGRYEP